MRPFYFECALEQFPGNQDPSAAITTLDSKLAANALHLFVSGNQSSLSFSRAFNDGISTLPTFDFYLLW